MTIDELIGEGIRDKASIKHQFRTVPGVSTGEAAQALPIFKIMDKEELETKDRYLIIEKRLIQNSFILGHPVNAVLGSGTLGDFRTSWTTERIIQSENIYREWFYDNKFEDTAVTTATWDTINHQITFGSAEVAQSTQIFKNNQNITSAILKADYSGSLSFEMCSGTGTNFSDGFETGTLDKWTASVADNAGVGTHTSKTGTYSMYTRWGAVDVTSDPIDLSDAESATLKIWIRRGHDDFSENPDAGEDLVIRYLNNVGGTVDLETFAGDGVPGESYDRTYTLSSDAFHSNFRIIISQLAGSGSDYDYWHIDDVSIESSPFFESVTEGEEHTFENVGQDLRWRATETAGGAATIDSLIIEFTAI